jgi:membrane-bound lytic murein transglycosylase MltF
MRANRKLWSTSGVGVVLVVAALVGLTACGARDETALPDATAASQPTEVATEAPTSLPSGLAPLVESFTGDLDGMIERRVIRVLTVQNPILYFVDQGREVGILDIEKLESNIHAGVKYLRWMIDTYYNEPGVTQLNRGLFAFASYNAGPAKVASLRREAAAQGLDPDKWFNNVELIAAKRIGRETVTYVANIYKYYLAYRMMEQQDAARAQAKTAAGAATRPADGG